MKEKLKKKVYYAHSMGIYNTKQEERDIELLEELGFEVINPNCMETSNKFKKLLEKDFPYEKAFELVFGSLVFQSDLLAFRAQLDGFVGAGVAAEIEFAQSHNKPVIELPSALYKRIATPDQTRAYLKEVGQR